MHFDTVPGFKWKWTVLFVVFRQNLTVTQIFANDLKQTLLSEFCGWLIVIQSFDGLKRHGSLAKYAENDKIEFIAQYQF